MLLGETETERELRRLVELIDRKGGTITPRDLQRANNRRYRTGDEAQADLMKLAEPALAPSKSTPPRKAAMPPSFSRSDPARRTTLDPTGPPPPASPLHDTRWDDSPKHWENEASVVQVVRRAKGTPKTGDHEGGPAQVECRATSNIRAGREVTIL